MKFEDLLNGFLKMPKTHDEAKEYIKNFPSMKASIEEMAFRQVIINTLILSGLITENDFNASIKHFEEQLYDEFADELLKMAEEIKNNKDLEGLAEVDIPEDEEELEDEDNHHFEA